jgi:diacylglycerol kinase family enzyme
MAPLISGAITVLAFTSQVRGNLGGDMPAVSFVVNGSLAGVSGRFVPLCREVAARNGWTAEFHVTEKAEAGVAAAAGAALDGADLVVAVGGDGTVRGCAEGVASTGVPLGIVPHGTANLLARTLGIPGHPRAALAVALDHRRAADDRVIDRVIDLAIADREPFTAMAGMGLDAAVVAGTKLKHQFGWFAYAISGAAHLASPPTRFTIKLDDNPPIERTARSVVVGNSGLLPGGFALLPDARLDDGLLDVGVLAPHGPLGWTRLATRVLTHSQHQDRMLERFQARRVEITSGVTLPREVDGEVISPGSALTVLVQPGTLTVRVPTALPRPAIGVPVNR